MGLTLGHALQNGANIDARIYTKVTELVSDQYATFEAEERGYDLEAEEPTWTKKTERFKLTKGDIETLDKEISIEVFEFKFQPKTKRWEIKILYRAPVEYPITKINHNKVLDPWRPAFKSDGISPEDFSAKPNELYVEQLRNGCKLIYAWVQEPKIGKDIVYCAIRKRKNRNLELVASFIEGKIAFPQLVDSTSLRYTTPSMTNEDCVQTLASNIQAIHGFKFVPTNYPFHREQIRVINEIIRSSTLYSQGKIGKKDLEKLIWNYKH